MVGIPKPCQNIFQFNISSYQKKNNLRASLTVQKVILGIQDQDQKVIQDLLNIY